VTKRFGIVCRSEADLLLTSKWEEEILTSLETLCRLLDKNKNVGNESLERMKNSHLLAGARDFYAWRQFIEAIKEASLNSVADKARVDEGSKRLLTDRPLMLKIAGEITNALFHSYNMKHVISMSQTVSKEPS
jgi:hypothetical protein